MGQSNLIWWLAVISVTAWQFLHQGGHAQLLNGVFHEDSTAGRSVRVYDTVHGARSCVVCASVCEGQRLATPTCLAFGCYGDDDSQSLTTMTCDFYTDGPSVVPNPGNQLFWMKETDAFHAIRVTSGQLHTIYLSSTLKNYDDAKALCRSVSGYLLQFDSLDTYEAVTVLLEGKPIMSQGSSLVGANDHDQEGHWVTDRDGSPLNPVLWLFKPGEPNNADGNEHCVILRHGTMLLDDRACSGTYTVLCQRKRV